MLVNFSHFPNELTLLPRWVLWRDKKIPFCASNPQLPASSTDPSTWSCFDSAKNSFSSERDKGVGFALTAEDGLACIDIDGNTGDGALALLRETGCKFIERSPSGNGLHGWGYFSGCELPHKRGIYRGINVEVYRDLRYMTVTGNIIDRGPLTELTGVADLSASLQKRTNENKREQKNTDVIFSSPLCSSVGEFLPDSEGQRNRCLFEFARFLKGKAPGITKSELRAVVQEWHKLALPEIGTKDFSTTWTDFRRGWKSVKFPYGETLEAVLNGVEQDTMPNGFQALGYGGRTILLAKICRRLADHQGDEPFFLSVRKAGELLGVHFTDASKMLAALVTDDVLRLETKGAGKVASRYRWVYTA